MLRKYTVPVLALVLLSFAVVHVVRAYAKPDKATPLVPPARAAFAHTVAGIGLVEAQTQNIAIGSALSGLVVEVPVEVGQRVKAGAVLFRLDDRAVRADVKAREANLLLARAKHERLVKFPREEDLPPARARVREAEANVKAEQRQLEIEQRVFAGGASSREQLVKRRQALETAQEQLARARADLALLDAGSWAPDKEVARVEVEQAQAQLEQARTEQDRLVVRAPVDGEVLQINLRPGEYAAGQAGQALIVLGNIGQLHVRVEIDEHDIPRFRPGARASAAQRGSPQATFPLTFVRVEPYVTPKKVLTNESSERVDTRVLQVIYAAQPGATLYVGQQVDVSVEATGGR
jgi:multidrug resistance efflux pump